MNNQVLVRELLRSRAHEPQELQGKLEMLSEALWNLQYAHDELQLLLQRETEATNELTAAVGRGPTSSGFASSFCVLQENVDVVLNGK
ncbi:unnamed protein product [Phytophthora fragariaefolia]|uniref:Unnamed protein product n=1 Tax=Phytophthora fragariaefolia TaxID=1490495 RepID=A0A9W6X9K5_9STRA|nr:unnamed protein product [Phytophthora fragariaefolia]